ncbi:hypothetical protein CPC08DRAFT_824847 [Agrocybe pediades]|nr:hypothetical protein CPC08DRAFT_824847 [Agrocybe pediades]
MDEHQAKLTEDFEEPCTRIANAFRLIQINLEFFLTSLDLKGRIELLPDELSQFLRMTSINRLEHLALPFKVFTADMFDLIVLRLPALQSFELKVNTCKGQYSEGGNNDCHWEWEFANDMKQRSYTKWGLKSFYLIKGSRSRMQGICFEAVARRIVQALPNVQTFNGSSSGADYLSRFPNPVCVGLRTEPLRYTAVGATVGVRQRVVP